MKTKENDKKSGSADRRFCGLRLFLKSGEQSQNVYENKDYDKMLPSHMAYSSPHRYDFEGASQSSKAGIEPNRGR